MLLFNIFKVFQDWDNIGKIKGLEKESWERTTFRASQSHYGLYYGKLRIGPLVIENIDDMPE